MYLFFSTRPHRTQWARPLQRTEAARDGALSRSPQAQVPTPVRSSWTVAAPAGLCSRVGRAAPASGTWVPHDMTTEQPSGTKHLFVPDQGCHSFEIRMITSSDQPIGNRPIAAARMDGGAKSRASCSILIVAPQWPHPPTWGFAMRVYQLAKELSSRHRVSLRAYGDEHAPRAAGVFAQVRLVPWPGRSQHKLLAQLASLGRLGSHHLTGLRSTAMQSALEQMAEREAFDIVQLESSQMNSLKPVPGACTVRLAAIESSPARRAFGQVESLKARRDETAAWRKSTGCVFTSDVDLPQMLQAAPSIPACVVPNGVDLEYFRPSSTTPGEDLIVYTGSINYRPNADGVAYFVREILPKIRRARPGARLLVVGRGAPDWLPRLASEHVEFIGAVEDIRPYLARAAVAVAPIRIGSGTRLRWFGPRTLAHRLSGRQANPDFWQRYIPIRAMVGTFRDAGLTDIAVRPVVFGLPIFMRGTKQYPIVPPFAEGPVIRASGAAWTWVSRRPQRVRTLFLLLAESYAVSGRREG